MQKLEKHSGTGPTIDKSEQGSFPMLSSGYCRAGGSLISYHRKLHSLYSAMARAFFPFPINYTPPGFWLYNRSFANELCCIGRINLAGNEHSSRPPLKHLKPLCPLVFLFSFSFN